MQLIDSPNIPKSRRVPRPRLGTSDDALLERHREAAQIAAAATWNDMQRDLVRVMDIRPYVRSYPWVSMGASIATGMLAAGLLVPGRGAEKIQTATQPQPQPVVDARPRSGIGGAIWSALIAGLYGLARVTLTQFIGSVMRTDPEEGPEDGPVEEYATETEVPF